jgi:hypothetical protein
MLSLILFFYACYCATQVVFDIVDYRQRKNQECPYYGMHR